MAVPAPHPVVTIGRPIGPAHPPWVYPAELVPNAQALGLAASTPRIGVGALARRAALCARAYMSGSVAAGDLWLIAAWDCPGKAVIR